VAQRRAARDVRWRIEVERDEQMPCGDEREVALNLSRPNVERAGLIAGEAAEHDARDDALPPL
jgi:hypothetical protein